MATQLDYPIPQRPSTTQLLTAFNSASVRWPGALRAGLAILLPGAIALLTGHDYAILLISTGAFTVIFGEGHPYRTRPRVMLTAGTALITVAAVGVPTSTPTAATVMSAVPAVSMTRGRVR